MKIGELWGILLTFGLSLVPGADLRIGIPVGITLGVPVTWAVVAASAGNILQIGLMAFLFDRFYGQIARWPRIHRWVESTREKAQKYQHWIKRYGWLGLIVFVMVPLPGTGVIGGVLVARLLGMPALMMWAAIGVAVSLTGLIFGLGTQGTLYAIRGF